ncbi:BQ2448_2204 [Microbotryum intermedium]|uniref:BQ2448_2204 protein n=1 Tax=Microbotryum intermedium TaxID=269621 RepID=A0A238FBA4_9BASI|nr:BQ2448_2204 [Microbotryum intermedium]
MSSSPFDESSLPSHFTRPEHDPQEEPVWSTQPNSDERGDEANDAEALYAVLNLPKQCTDEEIQKQYKRLAALLHPDRHRDPALKAAADSRFQRLNHAFEILSDPHKRAIYDELGEEGLHTNWEVGPKHKTPAELRAEFERLGRKQLEADVERLIKSKGELTCTTDARVLFLPDEHRRKLGGPPDMTLWQKMSTVNTRQLFLKHSFVNPISPSTTVMLTSQLLARQGVGAGNVLAKVLYNPTSRLSLEVGTTFLRPRSLPMKATYTPDPDSFITINTTPKSFAAPPIFAITLGRRLFEETTGVFTLRTGQYSLFGWGISSLEPVSSSNITFALQKSRGWSCSATTGMFGSSLSGEWGRVMLGGVKVSVGGALSTQGTMSTFVSGDRRVTEDVRAGMTLDLGMNGVMTVKLRWVVSGPHRLNRLGQRLNFPIIISSNWDPRLALSFTVVPALSIIAFNQFVIAPRKKQKLSSKIKELRQEHSEYIREKRHEAEEAIALLVEHVRKKVEQEEKVQGLIIESAWYGVLSTLPDPLPTPRTSSSIPKTPASDVTIAIDQRYQDVTIPLQALVNQSQLVIPAGRSKAHLLGFYDCAFGEKKSLRVRYRFRGAVHECEIADRDALAMPLRGHLKEE